MTTNATRDLTAAGEAIEEEVKDAIERVIAGLGRYEPDLAGTDTNPDVKMSPDSRGDWIERADALSAVRDAT